PILTLDLEGEVLARQAGIFRKAQFGGARPANGEALTRQRDSLHLSVGALNQQFGRHLGSSASMIHHYKPGSDRGHRAASPLAIGRTSSPLTAATSWNQLWFTDSGDSAPAIAPPIEATESASPPVLAAISAVSSADPVIKARLIARGTMVSARSGK